MKLTGISRLFSVVTEIIVGGSANAVSGVYKGVKDGARQIKDTELAQDLSTLSDEPAKTEPAK